MKYALIALAIMFALAVPAHAAPNVPALLSIKDVSCSEATGKCVFGITKSKVAKSSSFTVETFDLTAKAGTDYTTKKSTVTLAGSTGSTSFTVTVRNDVAFTGIRQFAARITVISNGDLTKNIGTATIFDDEAAPPVTPTQTCWDGTVIPAASICPAKPPTTSVYSVVALAQGGLARAKMNCPSIYHTDESDRNGILYEGVTAGAVYGNASWAWWPGFGEVWSVGTGASAAYVQAQCLEGVKAG